MSDRIERTLRVVEVDEPARRPVDYWRTRSYEERLAEAFKLHREGNELFRGGNPPFLFQIEIRRDNDRG